MSNVFPEPSINRVDVTKDHVKIYASIDTINSSVQPFWIGEEDLSPFIKYYFNIIIEESRSPQDRASSERSFDLLEDPFVRTRSLEEVYLNARPIDLSLSMLEIRQGVYETSIGSPVSQDFATNKLHFDVEHRFGDGDDIMDRLEDSNNGISLNIIYYAHIDYEEVFSHYNITNGQGEILTLGGIGKYQPVFFASKLDHKFSATDSTVSNLQIGFDTSTPFEGYMMNPVKLEEDDMGPATLPGSGIPDPFSWRSRVDYHSIYTAGSGSISAAALESEAVERVVRQSALRTVQDQSFAMLEDVSWINYTDNLGGDHSSMFAIDKLKVLRNLSPLGFLLGKENTVLEPGARSEFLDNILSNSKIECMKITRKKLKNYAASSNRVATSDYEFEHTGDESYIKIYETTEGSLVGMSQSDISIEQVEYGQVDSEDENFARAVKFILRDSELFKKINYGKYKYEVEITMSDSIPDYVSLIIELMKEGKKDINKLLCDASGAIITSESDPDIIIDVYDSITESKKTTSVGNYNFLTNRWSDDYRGRVSIRLQESIQLYFQVLGILGIDALAADNSAFIDSILPERNGSLDSLMLFYDSYLKLENILIKMYDKVTNYEEGLNSEVYGSKRRVPSNSRTNMLEVKFNTLKPIQATSPEEIYLDYSNLDNFLSFDDLKSYTRPSRVFSVNPDSTTLSILTINQLGLSSNQSGQVILSPEELTKIEFNLEYVLRSRSRGVVVNYPDELLDRYVANVAEYLPSTTIEVPSINRTFRSSLEGLAAGAGTSSENYSFLESSLIKAYNKGDDGVDYISSLAEQETSESELARLILSNTSGGLLNDIFSVIRTLENVEAQQSDFSSLSIEDKYLPRTSQTIRIGLQGQRLAEDNHSTINRNIISFVEPNTRIENTGMIIVNNVRIPGVQS